MVYYSPMAIVEKTVRQSISLPPRVAKKVKALAKSKNTSSNRVIVDLIEAGLESKEDEKRRFFELADELTRINDPAERKRIKEQLARMTFGE